jgi:carbon-monoxide dehydrogenase medium subunit
MKPAQFYYHRPTSIDEAVSILHEVAPDDGRVLAGGQSLVPTMAFRMARPRHLVDINEIEALRRLEVRDGKLCIGACVRHGAFHEPAIKNPLTLLLSRVVRHIAHAPIRSRGTFCGSIANADPASEWCTVAVCLDAEMVAQSARGTRVIPARDFFQGVMTTALREDELLAEVRLPLLDPDTRSGFYEFIRRAGDFAIAMALVAYRVDGANVVQPRIAVGGAEPHPRRMEAAERTLDGVEPSPESFVRAADFAAEGIVDPLEDAATSAQYRVGLVRTVTERALQESLAAGS